MTATLINYRSHPITYAEYIKSDAWRLSPARLAELIDSGGCCRLCNTGGPDTTLSLHHRTYKRLGHERPGDLTALCVPCHDVVTDMLRARAYGERELPPLRDVEAPADTVLVDTTYRTVP